MTLTLDWQTDTPGRATIRQHGMGVARLLGSARREVVEAFLSLPVRDRLVEAGDITAGGVVVERLDPEEAD